MYGRHLVGLSWILNWSQVNTMEAWKLIKRPMQIMVFWLPMPTVAVVCQLEQVYVLHDCVKFILRLMLLLSRSAENTELVWYPSFMSTYHLENPISEYIHLPTLSKCLDTKRDRWSLQNLLTLTDFELENFDLVFIDFSFYHDWDSK